MKPGRPTEYKPQYCKEVEKLCRLGLIDKELAYVFGVSEKTLNTWKKKYPEFLQSIKKGKTLSDVKVVESLFKRANGYSFTETTTELVKGVMKVTKKVTKHIPGEVSAQCFFLKNRQPDKWRDKHEVDATIQEDLIVTLNLDT
jgi:hypothetical protein